MEQHRRVFIAAKLSLKFSPSFLKVVDESHLNKRNLSSGAEKETHFRIFIKSIHFDGKKTLDCNKLIYEALREEMKAKVLALAINIIR
jgi:BolA family transcriptional regulator, general stress-responsive regulator